MKISFWMKPRLRGTPNGCSPFFLTSVSLEMEPACPFSASLLSTNLDSWNHGTYLIPPGTSLTFLRVSFSVHLEDSNFPVIQIPAPTTFFPVLLLRLPPPSRVLPLPLVLCLRICRMRCVTRGMKSTTIRLFSSRWRSVVFHVCPRTLRGTFSRSPGDLPVTSR